MKNTGIYFLTALLAGLASCSNEAKEQTNETEATIEYKELKKAGWFLGDWENRFPDGLTTESWTQVNDSTYTGTSFTVIGKDTVSSETIRLEERHSKLYYIPTVKDQNKGKAVKFELTKANDHMLVFENPEHDFPQKITYRKITSDSIVAEISGKIDGKEQAEEFPMGKVK